MGKQARRILAPAAAAAAVVALALTVAGAGPFRQSSAQAVDRDAAIEARIDDLIGQMTLREKLGQLTMLPAAGPDKNLSDEQKEMVRNGDVGSFLGVFEAANANEAQRVAVRESRLGIPLIFGLDVIHGYRTMFPTPLAESSTWDPALAQRNAHIAAREARAAGVAWTFAPMVDIARDARWGRIVEGAGEDPLLGAAFARARVRGFQGGDYSQPDRMAATAKHWVAYGAAEAGREYNTVDVAERTLRGTYFPPFRAANLAGIDSFMTSFNEISGIPATANRFTLTNVLRNEWHEDGPVLSDYTAVAELRVCPVADPEPDPGKGACGHGVAANGAEAAMLALNAGTDIEMTSELFRTYGPELVSQGLVSMDRIDQAVRRVLRLKLRAGLFQRPFVDPNREQQVLRTPAHIAQARATVARSAVLLENHDGALPLSDDLERVAVVGPLADDQADMLGAWSFTGDPDDVRTVLAGVRSALPGADVTFAEGCDPDCEDGSGFDAAVQAAEAADVTIVVVGESAALSGEASSRARIGLPGQQLQLVKRIAATGQPYVVVLMSGRPLELGWLHRNAPALLEAWHAGTEAGDGIADVLFGLADPGGQLTVSFPRAVGQEPLYYDQKPTGRPFNSENKFTSKYLDVPNTPLYEFGYGLSYTSFAVSDVTLSATSVPASGTLTVTAKVTNTGSRAGDQVVQLYLRDRVSSVTRPVKELHGFERVELAAGASETVSFTLDRLDFGFFGAGNRFVVEPGEFDVWVGKSSAVAEYPADEADPLHRSFTVTGLAVDGGGVSGRRRRSAAACSSARRRAAAGCAPATP